MFAQVDEERLGKEVTATFTAHHEFMTWTRTFPEAQHVIIY
jgi:hypothetical protein